MTQSQPQEGDVWIRTLPGLFPQLLPHQKVGAIALVLAPMPYSSTRLSVRIFTCGEKRAVSENWFKEGYEIMR